MPFYHKRPVVVEARQYVPLQGAVLAAWCGGTLETGDGTPAWEHIVIPATATDREMWARRGDWIIRGVAGEFYRCPPDVFAATYEKAPPL